MVDQSPIQELVPVEQDFKGRIGGLIKKAEPGLRRLEKDYPEGFQIIIAAPSCKISSKDAYSEIMGFSLDPVGSLMLGMGGELFARPELGYLNVTRDESGNVMLDYRPKKDGENFVIRIGKEIEVSGITPKEAYEALSMIFDKQGALVFDDSRINAMTIRSLRVFDKGGGFRDQGEGGRTPPVLPPSK